MPPSKRPRRLLLIVAALVVVIAAVAGLLLWNKLASNRFAQQVAHSQPADPDAQKPPLCSAHGKITTRGTEP